jgi:hypothetical protein
VLNCARIAAVNREHIYQPVKEHYDHTAALNSLCQEVKAAWLNTMISDRQTDGVELGAFGDTHDDESCD